MLTLDELLAKSNGYLTVLDNFRGTTDEDLTEVLTIVIPDLHLLEKDANDDFLDGNPNHEKRFVEFLIFLNDLKTSGEELEVIQVGDLYDLWQAKGNTNLIYAAYPNVLGWLDTVIDVYVVGNHDFDLVKWYEDRGETFGRKLRQYSLVQGKRRVIYEHGYQADFFNNQESWSGKIGHAITEIINLAENLDPDIDVELGNVLDSMKETMQVYNESFTPRKNPQGFKPHEFLSHYIDQMEDFNRTSSPNHPIDLSLAVVGHTHAPRLAHESRNGRDYYLMDCGSWVNGHNELGVISGREMAVCRWT